MKFSRIAICLLLIFTLPSCSESLVKTKEAVPVKGVPKPHERKEDSTNLFRKHPEEKEKTKFKQDTDTLKPKLALNLNSIRNPFQTSKIE